MILSNAREGKLEQTPCRGDLHHRPERKVPIRVVVEIESEVEDRSVDRTGSQAHIGPEPSTGSRPHEPVREESPPQAPTQTLYAVGRDQGSFSQRILLHTTYSRDFGSDQDLTRTGPNTNSQNVHNLSLSRDEGTREAETGHGTLAGTAHREINDFLPQKIYKDLEVLKP